MKMLGRLVRALDWMESWTTVRGHRKTEKRRWRKDSEEEFAQYAEESLAIANETFEASAETWPRE